MPKMHVKPTKLFGQAPRFAAAGRLGIAAIVAALTGCWPALQQGPALQAMSTSDTAAARTGTLQITIKWPLGGGRDLRGYHAQLIPDSTSRVDVTVTNSSNAIVGSGSVVRLAGQATTSVNVQVPYANNLSVKAEAFPAANGPAGNTGPIARGSQGGVNVSANEVSTSITMGTLYLPDIAGMNVNVGKVTDDITFSGSNLAPAWALTPTVVFNTATASVVTANPDGSVTVRVPTGATTGGVRFIADNVRSDLDTVFWVASGISTTITSAQQSVNGHTLPAGMAYYGTDMRVRTVSQFVLDTGNSATDELGDFQASASVPAAAWANTNSLNALAADSTSTVGATTLTQNATVSFAPTNQSGNIRAALGSLTSANVPVVAAGINSVTLSPLNPTINAMPPIGETASDSFVTTVVMTATVNHSLPFNDGVAWTQNNGTTELLLTGVGTETVTVTTPQTVSGVASGSGTVTATSIAVGTHAVTTTINVTDYGSTTTTVE